MGQALYRKYRSKSLNEIVGQDHITQTLQQAVKQGRISHAYLFTGPRGVGKTSIARILAHEINGLAYNEGQTHLDIIEIDAASNRRIDEIRDLRDRVYIAPAQAKYKVYIIDEVHMLTKEAFNALLKTLEEPPAHVVFILATTEMHKLPATIVSRTQRFVFKPIETTKAISHLKYIAKQEKITISDEALGLIAEHGDGSFRDSISLLDQAAGQGGNIDADAIQLMLGVPPRQAIEDLLAQMQQNPAIAGVMSVLSDLYDQGFQAIAIAKQLGSALRTQLIGGTFTGSSASTTALLTKLLEVPVSSDPERYLEIALLDALPPTQGIAVPPLEPIVPATPAKAVVSESTSVKTAKPSKETNETLTKPAPATTTPVKTKPLAETKPTSPKKPASGILDEASWGQVLNELKKQYNTLYSVARMAKPRFLGENKLELAFAFAFHQKRLSEAKNHQILSNAIASVTGAQVEIICVLATDVKTAAKPTTATHMPPQSSNNEPLSAISNIFGGGELLES